MVIGTGSRIRALSLAACLTLSGCALGVDYGALPAGEFTGSVVVIWLGEGGPSGDGRFLFVPDPKQPLTFARANRNAPAAIIRPSIMYTDGGSIPRLAQAFKGFSPWGYAPAYMVHDWLFVANHCLTDGRTGPPYDRLRGLSFDESAKIIGEAIKGLVAADQVKRDDTAASLITAAVGTSYAKGLWDRPGACAEETVTEVDRALAERIVPGSSSVRTKPSFRIPDNDPRLRNARIVSRVGF
jgi:hypothetical protein